MDQTGTGEVQVLARSVRTEQILDHSTRETREERPGLVPGFLFLGPVSPVQTVYRPFQGIEPQEPVITASTMHVTAARVRLRRCSPMIQAKTTRRKARRPSMPVMSVTIP